MLVECIINNEAPMKGPVENPPKEGCHNQEPHKSIPQQHIINKSNSKPGWKCLKNFSTNISGSYPTTMGVRVLYSHFLKVFRESLSFINRLKLVGESSYVETVEDERNCVRNPRTMLIVISVMVVRSVERFCGFWGLMVAKHPIIAVIGCLVFVSFLGSGIARINLVFRPYDLWVPQKSEFSQVTAWKAKNFPRLYREQVAIWEGENILSASSIREMLDFHKEVERMKVHVGNRTIKWSDVCARIPTKENEKSSIQCLETSILEIWGYDPQEYINLTDASVLEDLNKANISKIYGAPLNFSHYLGGVTRDKYGNIVKAKVALHTWLTAINDTDIGKGEYEMDVGNGEKIDLAGLEWEKALARKAESWQRELRMNIRASHTLGYVLHNSIASDSVWIGVGWTVLLVYILLTLAKPTKCDQRIIPACVGFLAIGMSILSSYGACSLVGIPYGTLTNVLPVLLVALGVDDMYVIVTSWDQVRYIDSVELRAQMAMQKAGMAITVTSVTDIVAFLVGTTTSLPGLRWFCIYSAVGILMVYFLQATLFVAAMVLNQRWNNSRRKNGKKELIKIKFHKFKFNFGMKTCLRFWGKCLSYHITKAAVLFLTCSMFTYSIFNISQLSRDFDPLWLVPESSGLYKWFNTMENTFPQNHEKGVVLFKGAKFPDDLTHLKSLSQNLTALPEVLNVEAWFNEIDVDELFEEYPWLQWISPSKQCKLLLKHISFANQKHFRINLNMLEEDETTNRTHKEHPCSTFQIEFQYVLPKDYKSKQVSMKKIRDLVRETKIEGYKAAWAHAYGQWETDSIFLGDLFKSLGIVLCAVALISLILLASVRASFFVLLCVVGTLCNVASTAYLWGLTVNTITGIALVLAIGICVDYAVHIAQDFLTASGTKFERVNTALMQMGSAVFHGGTSTCLTFILLSPSDSYIFVSYFKILTCVSIFGLYHALVFLPAILSLCGPDPHPKWNKTSFNPSSIINNSGSACKKTSYAMNIPLPYNPPSYAVANGAGPPLYRKSNSLPSLAYFLSSEESPRRSQSPSQRSVRHSTCSTKL